MVDKFVLFKKLNRERVSISRQFKLAQAVKSGIHFLFLKVKSHNQQQCNENPRLSLPVSYSSLSSRSSSEKIK
jgi:hypothetical protein